MGRSPCCEKAHINKGAWTKEEDDRLVAHIRAHGEGCWRSLPQAAGLQRCGKSCRLRWINYLRPDLKRGNFTREEDDLIIKLHSLLGNKWSLIAARLPGRTDNEIKNYWNTHIRRKLLSRGIDPSTHQPIRESPSEVSIPFAKGEDKAVVGGGLLREGERCSSEERCSSSLSQTLLLEEEQRRLGLNLDLCISLPHEQQQKQKPSRSSESFEGQRGLCFGCGLGVQKSKECKCNSSFLGLGIGVLDFRDLEMKL